MVNRNGQLLLETLMYFDEPVTITRIVAHVAETEGMRPEEVKETVRRTLRGGVRHGYVERINRKYFATPIATGPRRRSRSRH